MTVSLVIRTYNEVARLERLLEFVKNEPIEIIVVDNGSTDSTQDLLKKYSVKVANLAQEDFSYPKSLNLGFAEATGDIVVMFSAHCLPCYSDWLEVVKRHFTDEKVAGMYGMVVPEKDSPFFEKLTAYLGMHRKERVVVETRTRVGVLGGTNAAIRRSLWEQHPFSDEYAAGGEDGEWARWAFSQGYLVVLDTHFKVYHSHYLTFFKAIKQQLLWRKLVKPHPFSKKDLAFRNDITR